MAGSRKYQLLCPIARALDRIGDRWTLLILRDLHAGPARFSELQTGLKGIATNLLTTRLEQLTEDGLIRKTTTQYGVALYELTDTGSRSNGLLFELALFGGHFPPNLPPRRPGNLRTVAVTLKSACQRVVTPELAVRAGIVVDGEHFELVAEQGQVEVLYREAKRPDVVLTTDYEPMVAAADGRMPLNVYLALHVATTVVTPGKEVELQQLLTAAMQLMAGPPPEAVC